MCFISCIFFLSDWILTEELPTNNFSMSSVHSPTIHNDRADAGFVHPICLYIIRSAQIEPRGGKNMYRSILIDSCVIIQYNYQFMLYKVINNVLSASVAGEIENLNFSMGHSPIHFCFIIYNTN